MTCRCPEDHPYALGKCDEKDADSSGEEASGNLGVQRHSGMCSDKLKEDTADHSFPEVLGTVPSHEDVVKETDISFKVNEVETSVDQGGIVNAAGKPDLVQEERRTDSDEVMNEVCPTRMFRGQEYDFRCIYCKVLPRKGVASRSELYRHYASYHFRQELKREFGNVTVCPVCGIEMKSCWRHIAEVHDEVEKYLPERAKIPKAITYRRPRKLERTRMKGKLAHNSDSTACRFPAIPEGYNSGRGINLNEDGEAYSNGPLVVDGFIIEEQVVEEAEEEEQSYLLSQDEKLECAVCGEMFSRGHFKPAIKHWKEQHGLRRQGPNLNLDLLSLISAGYLK